MFPKIDTDCCTIRWPGGHAGVEKTWCDRGTFTRSGYFSHLKSSLNATILLLPKPLPQHGHLSSLFARGCSFFRWTIFPLNPHPGLAHLLLSSSLRLGICSSRKPSLTSLLQVRCPSEVQPALPPISVLAMRESNRVSVCWSSHWRSVLVMVVSPK